MATTGGPNTVEDGLVFGVDTGYPLVSDNLDSYKFNKGEPTTNKLNNTILGQGNGASLDSDDFGTYIQLADITSSYSRLQIPSITVVSNEVYTWSFEIYLLETMTRSGNYTFDTNAYSDQFPSSNDDSRVTATHNRPDTIYANEWTPISLTVTMQDSLTGAYAYDFFNFYYPGFQNQKVYYRNMQFETKGHKSPYAGQGGTRSVSGSLIDLTRTTDIDLSNVSFDSNAQMSFDGTDDSIAIPSVTLGNGNWTVEFVANANSSGYHMMSNSSGGPVSNAMGVLSNKMHYKNYDGAWQSINSNTTVNYNEIYHLVYVNRDGGSDNSGSMDMYINGEKDSNSGTNSYTTNGGPVNAIGRSWAGYFDGEIYICRRYTTGLSDEEVKQNYNALKGRFNI